MEPPYVLQQIKRDITASEEWERIVHDLCILLEQASGRQQLRNFEGLSKQEKHKLMRQAASQLQRTGAFNDLQSKISATQALAQLDVDIPSQVFLHTEDESRSAALETRNESLLSRPSSKLGSDDVAKACAYLLQEHYHLKHYLKKCFNHPLPAELRIVAWKTLLQRDSSVVRRESMLKPRSLSVISFKEGSKEDREISKRCEATLRSSPFLSRLARSSTIVEAMKSIMAFWSRYKEGRPSDRDFLLCIPFLYTWQSKLESVDRAPGTNVVRSMEQMQSSITDIAEVYVSFIEQFLSKVSSNMLKTVDNSVQEVEDLLDAESPTLYKHLVRILSSDFQADHDTHSQSRVRLRKLIHVHLQKMFVGDLPMEVVCYIWDQCFIATISDFQCLKYFTTSWFIILRYHLLTCQTEEDVKRILTNKQYNLRIAHFQSEIDKRFLGQISSSLEVVPFQTKVSLSKQHEKVASITQPMRSPPLTLAHASRPRRSQQPATGRVSSNKRVKNQEKHKFEIQSDLLEQERKKHKRELEDLTLEVELLRQKVEGLNERPTTIKSSVLIEAASSENFLPPNRQKGSSTLLKCDSSARQQLTSQQTLASLSEDVVHDQPLQIQEMCPCLSLVSGPFSLRWGAVTTKLMIGVSSNNAGPESTTSAQKPKRPFSPGNLMKDDVTNIWFMIFQRFTSAVSLIFHGNEKYEMDNSSQQRSLLHDQDDLHIQDQ